MKPSLEGSLSKELQGDMTFARFLVAILKLVMHSPGTGMVPHYFCSRDLLEEKTSPAGMADHQRLTLPKSVLKAKKCIALIRTTQCMSKEIMLLIIHLT